MKISRQISLFFVLFLINNFYVASLASAEVSSDAKQNVYVVGEPLGVGKDNLASETKVLNDTKETKNNYKIGVPKKGLWKELLNSDSECYFGSNIGNLGEKYTYDYSTHARPYTLEITVPPLAAVFFKYDNTKNNK